MIKVSPFYLAKGFCLGAKKLKILKNNSQNLRINLQKTSFFGIFLIGSFFFCNFEFANAQSALPVENIGDNINADKNAQISEVKINYQNSIAIAANTSLRIDKNRDQYRHPVETLAFFGIKPSDKVIEIWPGQGWYSTILAPYLKAGNGQLIAAHFDTSTTNSQLVKDLVENYRVKYTQDNDKYGNVSIVSFGPKSSALGEKDSVDAVLTFRNIHNWMGQGWADKAFDDFFKVLKPGGILGIEEHRADDDGPQDPLAADGYVREDYVIDMALDAGFEFVGASQINANPKDTKDHPFGVWTLPPVSRSAPQGKPANPNFDNSKYLAIGESDRMTLLFRKPIPPPPIISAQKLNKLNPVKVIFGNPKTKVSDKKTSIDGEEERLVVAAKDVAVKSNNDALKIEPPKKDEIKEKADIQPEKIAAPKAEPIAIPVKFDSKTAKVEEKPIVKTEIKPPVIDKEVKPDELPNFTLPQWVDVKNPAPIDEVKEVAKKEAQKTEPLKIAPLKSEKPKTEKIVKKVEKPKAEDIKPKANSVKTSTKTEPKNKKPEATNSKKSESSKSKTAAKPNAKETKDVKSKTTSAAKSAGAKKTTEKAAIKPSEKTKTNSKASTKPKTDSVSKNSKTTQAKKAPSATGTKAKTDTKSKTKTSANVPDWVPPKKKSN